MGEYEGSQCGLRDGMGWGRGCFMCWDVRDKVKW